MASPLKNGAPIMVRYFRILLVGIAFALLADILGVFVVIVRCVSAGIKVSVSDLVSVAFGVGAREAIYAGLVVMLLMLLAGQGRHPPG
jgi:hypothetical protein